MLIGSLSICKTILAASPGIGTRLLCITAKEFVVIYNNLIYIIIPLAWKKHISTCILKHRNKERHYITLGVKVLHSVEDPCPLPLPSLGRLVVIPTMALPYGKMSSFKTVRDVKRFGNILNQYRLLHLCLLHFLWFCRGGVSLRIELGSQLLQCGSVCIQGYIHTLIFVGKIILCNPVHILYSVVPERIVTCEF